MGLSSILVVSDDNHNQRLDNFLFSYRKNIPKSRIYRGIREGEIRINGKRAKADSRIQEKDEIRLPPWMAVQSPAEKTAVRKVPIQLQHELKNRILFEDKQLIILNKPSGVPVHGGTEVSWGIIEALRIIRDKEKFMELAHRLDRETSGCLMIAKSRKMLTYLHALFREGHIQKKYLALVEGKWPKALKEVDAPLLKEKLETGAKFVKVDRRGKIAKTLFKIVKQFSKTTLVEASPLTGRTHQIRVHAQIKGHPIAGDSRYAEKAFLKDMRDIGLNRLFLHAKSLTFLPMDAEKTVLIEAPLDSDLEKILAVLR